jgi:tRNA(fMet)-specific endonuclease VapC
MATMGQRDAILDSSMLIHHARSRNKRNSFFSRSLLVYYPNLSVISVYEIEFGAYRAGRASDIEPLQVSFNILPLTEQIARRAAVLEANLIRQNLQIGIKDTFIAATCLIHNLPLLTVNMRHFDRIAGLELIDLNTLPPLNN